MNGKFLSAIALLTLVMAIAVFWVRSGHNDAPDAVIGTALFPTMKGSLDTVTKIEIASVDKQVSLTRTSDNWQVVEKDGYPADFAKLSDLLNGLADATLVERKSARPENYAALGVQALTEPTTSSVRVKVDSASSPYELIVGNAATGRAGMFVRRPDDAQVWLVDHLTKLSAAPTSWLDRLVINVDAARVQRLTLASEEKAPIIAARVEGSDDFDVVNLPEGSQLSYDTVANSLSRALVNVALNDVRLRTTTLVDQISARYEIDDGSLITVIGMKVDVADEGGWIQVDVVPGDKSTLLSTTDLARLSRFEFKVADYTYKQFAKGLDDIVEPEVTDKK